MIVSRVTGTNWGSTSSTFWGQTKTKQASLSSVSLTYAKRMWRRFN